MHGEPVVGEPKWAQDRAMDYRFPKPHGSTEAIVFAAAFPSPPRMRAANLAVICIRLAMSLCWRMWRKNRVGIATGTWMLDLKVVSGKMSGPWRRKDVLRCSLVRLFREIPVRGGAP